MSKILLIPVVSPQDKLKALTRLTKKHFDAKEHFLIIAPDEKALKFVDDLLWKEPKESFIPHMTSQIPCSTLVTITTSKENVNEASYVFNITTAPIFLSNIKVIYEFDEQASGPRREALEARYQAYREKGFGIMTFPLPA